MKSNHSSKLLIGSSHVIDAIETGETIEKIFLLRTGKGPEFGLIKQLAQKHCIPISLVPEERIDYISKKKNTEALAFPSPLHYTDLQSAISYVVEGGQVPLFVLFDGITDVRNAGAIARTALCCGAQGLILPISHIVSLNEDAITASAGTLQQIILCRTPSVVQAIDTCKLNGINVIGTHMQGTVKIYDCDFSVPTVVVMGAEDIGISNEVIKKADQLISIPMVNNFNSLNVSVAAGMILYEAMKQRGSK